MPLAVYRQINGKSHGEMIGWSEYQDIQIIAKQRHVELANTVITTYHLRATR